MKGERQPIVYEIVPSSRIKVEMKSHPGWFAWATVKTVITAIQRLPNDLPELYRNLREPGMELFFSMNAFSLGGYSYHPETEATYDEGTYFFATHTKAGGVTRQKKEKNQHIPKVWHQTRFRI